MRKDPSAPRHRSRLARWVTIAWIVALAALLAGGLITFFFDPFGLPPDLWGALDQRASVVSMFIGAIGLPLAVAALLHQMRTGTKPSAKSESSEHPSGTDASAPTAATTSRSTTVSSETRPPAKESLIPPSQPRLPRTSTPINAADPQISIPGDHFAFRDNIIEKLSALNTTITTLPGHLGHPATLSKVKSRRSHGGSSLARNYSEGSPISSAARPLYLASRRTDMGRRKAPAERWRSAQWPAFRGWARPCSPPPTPGRARTPDGR